MAETKTQKNKKKFNNILKVIDKGVNNVLQIKYYFEETIEEVKTKICFHTIVLTKAIGERKCEAKIYFYSKTGSAKWKKGECFYEIEGTNCNWSLVPTENTLVNNNEVKAKFHKIITTQVGEFVSRFNFFRLPGGKYLASNVLNEALIDTSLFLGNMAFENYKTKIENEIKSLSRKNNEKENTENTIKESLKKITLPTNNNLKYHSVDLDNSFRIAFKEK